MKTHGFFLNTASGDKVIELFSSERDLMSRIGELISEYRGEVGEEECSPWIQELTKELSSAKMVSSISDDAWQSLETVMTCSHPDDDLKWAGLHWCGSVEEFVSPPAEKRTEAIERLLSDFSEEASTEFNPKDGLPRSQLKEFVEWLESSV